VSAPVVSSRVATVPNLLSLLRLLMVPVFAWLIVTEHDGWAFAVLVFSAASDYLDGYLARRWQQITRLGQVLDPAADRLYILSTLLGLAWRDLVPWWLVAVIVVRDLVLAATMPVLARHGYGTLPVHSLGKAATFCLLYAFPLILLAEVAGSVGEVARALGWAFAWWGTALYWWAGLLYVQQVVLLTRAAPGARSGRRAPGASPAVTRR
jgi:cardiolipin synthase